MGLTHPGDPRSRERGSPHHPRPILHGHGRLEVHGLVVDGVVEAEFPGVEHQAGGGHFLAVGVAVDGVAQDGVAEGFLHVDADLVGAAGEELTADQGGVFINGELLPLGHGILARAIVKDGHALAVHGVAADQVLDAAAFFLGHAIDGGEVDFAHPALRKGFAEAAVGDVVLRHDHAAAGVLVQAVDDAGAHFPADAAEVVAMMQQGIDQGAVRVSSSGVDDEARGFVQDEDVFVFEKDLQGDVLGDDCHGGGLGDGEGDGIAGLQGDAGLGRAAIERDVTVANEVLQAGA